MADTTRSGRQAELEDQDDDEGMEEGRWATGSLLAGLLLGAVIGAGAALLLAPQSGVKTRREIGRRGRTFRRDAERKLLAAKKDARRIVRERKEALLERVSDGIERLEERLEK